MRMRGGRAGSAGCARARRRVCSARSAAPGLRIGRLGGKAEVGEGCDERLEAFLVDAVGPLSVLDQHSGFEQGAGVGGDDGAVDAQRARGVGLAAGFGGVVVDELNSQLAAEGLSGCVDTARRGHCDRQPLEHESIVPVSALGALHLDCLFCVDNLELTTQTCEDLYPSISTGWCGVATEVHTPGLCCPHLSL